MDGVGHQMHNNFEFPPVQGFIDTINSFATLGVLQHVTEMDVNIYSGSANVDTELRRNPARPARQGGVPLS